MCTMRGRGGGVSAIAMHLHNAEKEAEHLGEGVVELYANAAGALQSITFQEACRVCLACLPLCAPCWPLGPLGTPAW